MKAFLARCRSSGSAATSAEIFALALTARFWFTLICLVGTLALSSSFSMPGTSLGSSTSKPLPLLRCRAVRPTRWM